MHTGLNIDTKNPGNASVVVLCAPYDRTASFLKGTARGPEAILTCLTRQIENWDRFTGSFPPTDQHVALRTLGNLQHLTPAAMVARVKTAYARLLDQGPFVLLLGGEHTVSIGALAAIASRRDPREITVCQIDAHLDLRDTDADYSDAPHGTLAHSTVMRRAHEMGYALVNVGARAYSREEIDFAHNNGIRVFQWDGGPHPPPSRISTAIRTKDVYVTLDADGIDPAHLPATGTPVQGGLEWYYAIDLLKKIFRSKNVIGADLVEVAPRPHDVLTEYGAAQLCYTMLAMRQQRLGRRRLGRAMPKE